jgi:hypothetical protein
MDERVRTGKSESLYLGDGASSLVCKSAQWRRVGAGRREYSRLLLCHRIGHTIPPWWCPEIADNRHRAKLPENPPKLAVSEHIGQFTNGWASSRTSFLLMSMTRSFDRRA